MKNLVAILSFFIASVTAQAFGPAHVVVYRANLEESKLEWFASKITGKHNGTIELLKGELRDNHGSVSGLFEINMYTIVNSDLSGEYKTKLENHLKSDDFFNVQKYPVATFSLNSLKPLDAVNDKGHTHTIQGNLTIRDKTNPISFTSKVVMERGKMSFEGEAVVDRSKYDVKFGSNSFFDNLGDKAIHDEFRLKFNMVLNP